MKKLLCLVLSLLLLLCACAPDGGEPATGSAENSSVPTTRPDETEPTEPTETTMPTLDPTLDDLRANLPVMDGSTSLIPLEAGIRAALFGKTMEEATLDVNHSTTWNAYWSLLDGGVDLIFSVPLSQDQWDTAAAQGVELETVPIAMEGFVFVVNAQNPVDTLTQEQLRGIYSGQITNWSEVGGLDEAIIPYQRNTDSGSQNYMVEFMDDTPLMDAPTEMRPASMSGLMDVVAINDNARGAIGYSVYAYAADMYGNGDEIKFIQVDGVAPSKATMATGEYPLLGQNFAIFNAQEPEDGYVRQLVDWIVSYDGQLALAQAGYVTLENIGFDYEEMTLSKYQGTGSGPAASATDPYVYRLLTVTQEDWGITADDLLEARSYLLASGKRSFRLSGLTDSTLLAEIHTFIDEQIEGWAWEKAKEVLPLAEKLNRVFEYETEVLNNYYIQTDSGGLPLGVRINCANGYFSVAVIVGYNNINSAALCYVRTETATWDLLTGKRLTPEELFCQGVDIDQVLNDYIRVLSQASRNELVSWDSPYSTKCDFAGLPTTGWHLTHNTIYFDQDNPYFAYGAEMTLDNLPQGTLTAQKARDFSSFIAGDNLRCQRDILHPHMEQSYEYSADGLLSCGFLPADASAHAEAINEAVRDYINTYYSEDAIRGYFEDLGYDSDQVDLYWLDYDLSNWGGRYAIFRGNVPGCWVEADERYVYYPYDACLIFDLETGARLQWKDLLLPGWEAHCAFPNGAPPEGTSLEEMTLCYIYQDYGQENLLFGFFGDGTNYIMEIPLDSLDL